MSNEYCLYVTYHRTGKFYVGKGVTKKVVGGKYKGSGTVLLECFKKYPKVEWITDVVSLHETEVEAYAAEAFYVDEDLILDPACLNLVPGGRGFSSAEATRLNIERWKNPEFQKKMSTMKAGHWLNEAFVKKIKLAASAHQLAKWQDPEYRSKMTAMSNETVKKTFKNSEFQSQLSKRGWAKPSVREAQSKTTANRWQMGPLRERQRIGVQKSWLDPVKRAIMSEQRAIRQLGNKWMTKGGIKKQVPSADVQDMETQGWKRGMK